MQAAYWREYWLRRYYAQDSRSARVPLKFSRRKAVRVHARAGHARALRLLETLGYESLDIDLTCGNPVEETILQEGELIVLDVAYLTEAMQQYLVEWIRLYTFAPLIVIGKRSYRRDVSSVLARGADAIVWLDDPLEVNVAHCRAVLRRAGIA